MAIGVLIAMTRWSWI